MRSVTGEWDPEVIDQAIPRLPERTQESTTRDNSGIPPVELDNEALEVYRGERPKLKDGKIDTSATLLKIGRVLFDAGANRPVIVPALRERDEALQYRKYTTRADAEEQYHRIVDELEEQGRNGKARLVVGGKPKPQEHARSQSQSLGNEVVSSDPEQSIRAVSFRGREKPGPREWIVDKAICKGHPASLFGESGIAKSLLAAHIGLHVAADGVDYWAGLRVRTVPVVYSDFELDELEHLRRVLELVAGMGLPDVPTKFHYLPLTGLPAAEAFKIAEAECRRLKAGLCIVDSVGFALDGDSELAKDVLRFHKERIQPIRDAGATPLLIDHQAKVIKGEKYSDKLEFGSVYKTNAVRSSFQVRGAWDGNELTTTFTHKKTNFGPKVEPFSLRLRFGKDLVAVERLEDAVQDPDREPSKKEQVLVAVEEMGRATSETVAAKTGINPLTVRNAISALVKEGALVDTGEKQGSYRIVTTHSHTTQGAGAGADDYNRKVKATMQRLEERER